MVWKQQEVKIREVKTAVQAPDSELDVGKYMLKAIAVSRLRFALLLGSGRGTAGVLALWPGMVCAALAVGAAPLPVTMMAMGVSTPTALPSIVIAEVFVLSGIVGIVAGQRYMRDGLIAAVGIHFWADVVWHILWPAVRAG